MAGMEKEQFGGVLTLPAWAVHEVESQVCANCNDIIVQQQLFDGSRRWVHVDRVAGVGLPQRECVVRKFAEPRADVKEEEKAQ